MNEPRRFAGQRYLEDLRAETKKRYDQRERRHPADRLRAVLAEMELLQEGTRAATYEKSVSGSRTPGPPRLDTTPLVDLWEAKAIQLARQAERDLDVALGRLFQANDSGTERDDRILNDYEGDSPEVAAIKEGCSASHVEKLRRRNGLRGRDGRERAA